jgi:hypothetical protein
MSLERAEWSENPTHRVPTIGRDCRAGATKRAWPNPCSLLCRIRMRRLDVMVHAHDATLLNSRGYRWAAAAFWIALALGAVAVALRGYPGRAFLLALALVVSVAFALAPTRLPRLFDLLVVVGAILNAAGYAWRLFSAPGPWDEITHGFTIGALTFGIGYLIATHRASVFRGHRMLLAVLVLCSGIAIGAWWEVFEFLIDKVPSLHVTRPAGDTISDIVMDSAGAALAALASVWVFARREARHSGSSE